MQTEKILIVFDSVFGNTREIALAIKEGFNIQVEFIKVQDVDIKQVVDVDLLIVGSPTRQFNPTKDINDFIKSIPAKAIKGKRIAAFDTRIHLEQINSKFLRFMVDKGGYAAKAIAKQLKKKGAQVIMAPEGFIVTGEQGPLALKEIERAKEWAKKISTNHL